MNEDGRPSGARVLQATLAQALAHFNGRRFADAEALYRKVLAASPDHADALNMLGLVMAEAGNPLQAIKYIDQAIRLDSGRAAYHTNRGEVLRRWGLLDEGLESCMRAAQLDPNAAEVRNNLGLALLGKGASAEALPHFRAAIAIRPSMPQAYFNLGRALKLVGQWHEALRALATAVHQAPDYAEAWHELATVHERLEDLSAAIAACERALNVRADFPEAYVVRGDAYTSLAEPGKAIESYRAALNANPNFALARYQLSLALLGCDAFAEGWQAYESRSSPLIPGAVTPPMLPMPMWQGEDLVGERLLVLTEQGYGDHIQFCRFVPRLAARGVEIVMGTSPEMKALSATLQGVTQIVTQVGDACASNAACWTFVGSLPLHLGIGADAIGMTDPYLRADSERVAFWRARLAELGGKLKVGLVWAGRPTHGNDWRRSIAFDQFACLRSVPGVAFIGLQTGERVRDADAARALIPITQLGSELRDFADTAALISALDLLISVDSAPVHLAGALGLPVWNLLPFVPDWRWRADSAVSRWYPTMRLFRQTRPGDWGEVLERVGSALSALSS